MRMIKGIVFQISVAIMAFQAAYVSADTPAGPGQTWYGPYTINKAARYWQNKVGHITTIHFKEHPDTPCDITNNERKVSYYAAASYDQHATWMFSVAASAQAQEKRVMVLLDKDCKTDYGLNLHGIEILSD